MKQLLLYLPHCLLLLIVVVHGILVEKYELTATSGGGFAMFSALDGLGSRELVVTITDAKKTLIIETSKGINLNQANLYISIPSLFNKQSLIMALRKKYSFLTKAPRSSNRTLKMTVDFYKQEFISEPPMILHNKYHKYSFESTL
jgi:hypothetical protein